MNKIIQESLQVDKYPEFASMEAYMEEINWHVAELGMASSRLRGLDAIKSKILASGINRVVAMEGYQFAPEIISKTTTLNSYTYELSTTNQEIALEAVEAARKTVIERIKEFIQKIIAFAMDLFGRIREYITKFVSIEQSNKRELAETQRLLNAAKQKQNTRPVVAQEGFSTGTLTVPAPQFLHIEYVKIIAETAKLEGLAKSFIKDTIGLLMVQFKHCKFIIEAYHKLMTDPTPDLGAFETTAQSVVSHGEMAAHAFHDGIKAFDCVEIIEEIRDNPHAGVLKYRVFIKPPTPEDMALSQIHLTTNLMKAQDLQDRLVKLNEEIVEYANQIKGFFVGNSKNFLDTINKLNDSALKDPSGNFSAHSDYIVQVHSFLVRGNLLQVVIGLNILNTVWKSVNALNTRVVKEFLAS